ncbi:3'(2'),5'-bisphosphate nucleotidase CysQ [Aquisalimonas sp.]|uniref:3'(2'),5'-bisphosphate nucleotidase CysQ n=1 Tax=Aquisalimonas sp. TaxID=1872621 RepID=UPI0025C0B79A|nr:3'(2'),5'-bisphosphate nucleotidase CysQ [Aquisalimonas sp.]
MNQQTLRRLLPQACQLARQAGVVIMGIYRQGFDVDTKADTTLITPADRRANALLRHGLARLGPELPIVSEETAPPPFSERRGWRRYWLLDPLDGTREFVRRSDQFTVNIALVEDHRPVLGIVHAPALGQTWFGGPDLGAFRQAEGGEPVPIRTSPQARDPLRVVLGRSNPGPRTRGTLARLPEHATDVWGASLKFCLIAEGRADFFPRYGPISEWDMGAPQAILEAAGGYITDMRDLAPVRYNTRDALTTSDILAFADDRVDWRKYLGQGE